MNYVVKKSLIGLTAVTVLLSGCANVKEIKVSEDVKKEVLAKAEDNKVRSEPVLKKKLNGLGKQQIMFWIDDENVLTVNPEASSFVDGNVILCSYNLESEESTEILNDPNMIIYDYLREEGLILLGNDRQAFVYDPKERKLEKVFDIDEQFKDGLPGAKRPKEEQSLLQYSVKLIKPGYISYVSKITSRTAKGIADKAEYTILNYKDGRKYTTESRCSAAGLSCKFDLTDRYAYISAELDKIVKLNLETGEKSSIKLSYPRIRNVFEDGTLFVECTEENQKGNNKESWYKVDFDNQKVTRYYENYEQKNLWIDEIDFKNKFIGYTNVGDKNDDENFTFMYGKVEGNKFVVTDKLFKNNEDEGCNTHGQFIFSPDHNKFITGAIITKWQDPLPNNRAKDDEYLFELK